MAKPAPPMVTPGTEAEAKTENGRNPVSGFRRLLVPLLLVSAACVLNHVWLGWILSPEDRINEFAVRVFIWSCQVLLVVLGIMVFFLGGTRKGKAKIFLFLASWIVSVLLLVIGAQFIPGEMNSVTLQLQAHSPETLLSMPQFADAPWTEEYFRELGQSSRRFRPYTMWERRAREGKYVNVETGGTRRTWNVKHAESEDIMRVWTFGGSTMWGTGARDDFTIASCLSRFLEESGVDVEVTNFGETGYVFTQEIVRLIMELRSRPAPDLVIFYDGANEAYAGYQSGVAGGFMDSKEFESTYNHLRYMQRYNFLEMSYYVSMQVLSKHCRLFQLLNEIPEGKQKAAGLAAKQAEFPDFPEGIQFTEVGASMTKKELDILAKRLVTAYEASSRVVEGLARGYGFKYLLLWQPVIFLEENTFNEELIDVRSNDPVLAYLCRQIRRRVANRNMPHFHDIAGVLKDRTAPLYFDFCHVVEPGNEMIAHSIMQILKEEQILSASPTHAEHHASVP